jgi:hypothetical protein
MSVVDENGWKCGRGFSNRDLAMVVRRLMRNSSRDFGMWPTFVGSHENSRRFQPLQKTLDRPQEAQSVTVNSTSRGRQNQWLSLCAFSKPHSIRRFNCRGRRKR